MMMIVMMNSSMTTYRLGLEVGVLKGGPWGSNRLGEVVDSQKISQCTSLGVQRSVIVVAEGEGLTQGKPGLTGVDIHICFPWARSWGRRVRPVVN